MGTILDPIPTWLIVLAVALLILAANELGSALARNRLIAPGSEGPSAVVQTAAFTLLSLLLAFSFSLSLGRYDERRAALVREANAIGTTFLRTKLLDAGSASAVRADLRDYVAQRITFARADADPQQRAVAEARSTRIQRHMWLITMQAARRDSHSTMVPLFVSALNDTIDLTTEEGAVLEAHIPDIVVIGLLLIALSAASLMGYGFGRQGQRAILPKILFALMIAIALGLVLDLDRPQRGLIRVNLVPLQTAQQIISGSLR